jgi:hypothetical protein
MCCLFYVRSLSSRKIRMMTVTTTRKEEEGVRDAPNSNSGFSFVTTTIMMMMIVSISLQSLFVVVLGDEGNPATYVREDVTEPRVQLDMKMNFDQASMICHRGMFAYDLIASRELHGDMKPETLLPLSSTWVHCPATFKVAQHEACILTPQGNVKRVEKTQLHQTLCDDSGSININDANSNDSSDGHEKTPPSIDNQWFLGFFEILKHYASATAFIGTLLLVWMVLGIIAIIDWRFWDQTRIYSSRKLNFVSVMAPHYVVLLLSGIYVGLEYFCGFVSRFPEEIVDSSVEGWLYFVKDAIFWILSANIIAHLWTIFWAGYERCRPGPLSVWSLTDHQWIYFRIIFLILPFFAFICVKLICNLLSGTSLSR